MREGGPQGLHYVFKNYDDFKAHYKMTKLIGLLSQIVGALWVIVIVFLYFFSVQGGEISWRISHLYYMDSFRALFGWGSAKELPPLLLLILIIGIEYLLFYLWRRFSTKEKTIDIQLSPFLLLIIFSFIFFTVAFSWFGFYRITKTPFFTPYSGIFHHYGFVLSALGFILFLCASLGKFFLQFIRPHESFDLKEFLLSFGMGAVLISLLLFVCGLFGWLRSIPIWGICVAALAISYKELWQWLKTFFKPQIHFQGSYVDGRIILFFILSIALCHNVLELIRPIPIGFDDLAVYMNAPRLLASGGELLTGIDAYSWGLFMSMGFLLFDSTTTTLFLSFAGGLLAFFGFYVCVQSYCEQLNRPRSQVNTYALFTATLFYTLPAIVFQSAKDMKVDLASLFFMLLAFLSFLTWRKKGQVEVRSLWLSGLFLGFAFTIKYTALFFIVAMLLYALLIIWKRHSKNIGITLIVLIACIGAPFAPYGIKNIVDTRQISVQSLRTGKIVAPSIAMNPPLTVLNGEISDLHSTGVHEEQGRYTGFDRGIRKYLLLPFTVTFNPLVSGMHVDIGYLFLALIPLGVILFIRKPEGGNFLSRSKVSLANSSLSFPGSREDRSPNIEVDSPCLRRAGCFRGNDGKGIYEILFVGIIYWLLWGIFAKGVIWYGFGGFIFLFLLIVEIMHQLKKEYWTGLRFAANSAIILWLLCALCLRTANLPFYAVVVDPVGLAYAGGVIDEQGYMKQKIPTYLTIMKIVNDDIDANKENPPKTYRVGTFMKYFIHQNSTLVLDDNQLDIFMSLSRDHDDQKTIARFKNAGFKYMIIDTHTATIDKTPERTLTAKYLGLINFIERNRKDLKVILDNPGHAIKLIQIL